MNLEELLRTAVDDGVRSVPPGFADGAIRRARRQRRTTRIAVAGGVAAFALAAAAVAVVDPTEPRTDAPPAESPTPDLVDDVTRFDTIRVGAATDAPWYADGELHSGDVTVPFDVPFEQLSLDRVVRGFVALVTPPGDGDEDVLYLVPHEGEPIVVDQGALSEVVVSPRGTEFAYTAEVPGTDGLPPGAAMRVVDADTGDRLHENASFHRTARPLRYASGDEIVAEYLVGAVLLYTDWRPGTEPEPRPYTNAEGVEGSELSPAQDLLVADNGRGHSVFRVSDQTVDQTSPFLWDLEPSQGHPRFSPDGRYLVSVGVVPTDETTSVTVRNANTGIIVDRFVTARPGPAVWESGTTVVFVGRSADGGEQAVVRCTVDVGCELATEPQSAGIVLGDF
jgi:hypothetical protein